MKMACVLQGLFFSACLHEFLGYQMTSNTKIISCGLGYTVLHTRHKYMCMYGLPSKKPGDSRKGTVKRDSKKGDSKKGTVQGGQYKGDSKKGTVKRGQYKGDCKKGTVKKGNVERGQ